MAYCRMDGETMMDETARAVVAGCTHAPCATDGTGYEIGEQGACASCITAALDAAVVGAEKRVLHEVNRVFCGGFASSLDLTFMRDMAERVAVAGAWADAAALVATFDSTENAARQCRIEAAIRREGA